ncbi:DUF2589 domain-containing protein [Phocaeicola sp.]
MATEESKNQTIPEGNEDAAQVMNTAEDIIEQAKEGVTTVTNDGGKTNDGIAENFKGLPMRELIGGPLFAAAEAQEKLACIALDYYNRIAFYGKDEKKSDGTAAKEGETRILKFTVNRPVEKSGTMTTIPQTVEAPFIGMVPIPSLLIDRVDIDFQMEVTDTNTEKATTTAEVSSSISAKWFAVQASISGKVSSSRENTRTTNQTAKYQVHVTASQQPQTEGLSKLMDIMASCIEPIPTDSGK